MDSDNKADLADGFVRIANELLEAVMISDLSKRELKILLAIIRKTYGWGKAKDKISYSQFEELTGIKSNHISTTLKTLTARKIVLKQDYYYSVNRLINDWLGPNKQSQIGTSPKSVLVPKQDYELVPKQDCVSPETGLKRSPKTVYTKDKKDTITKDKKDKAPKVAAVNIPSWVNSEIWGEFLSIRKKLKAVNSPMALNALINKLSKYRDQGHEPNSIIETSIVSSWKDVYEPKGQRNERTLNNAQSRRNEIFKQLGGEPEIADITAACTRVN